MKKSARGISLIETLIASALLLILFSGIMLILQMVLRNVGESRVRLVAASLAQDRLELARNLPYADVGVVGGIPQGSLAQNEEVNVNGQVFSIYTSVLFIDDDFDDVAPTDAIPADYKRVRVAVDWEGAFQPKSPLVFLTDIAPPGIESVENTGTLLLQVFDALGNPEPNAEVTIFSDAVIPTVDLALLTDNQGMIVLPGTPVCFECYQISVTKSGYSTDRTYSSTEVANPDKPYVSIYEGYVTPVSFEIDRLSTMQVKATRPKSFGYAPFVGVNFTLSGEKRIGTDTLDNVVYKFEDSTYVTSTFGQVTIANLEWDTYTLSLPGGSSVDIGGIVPTMPMGINPGGTSYINFIATANSPHSLLLVAENGAGGLLPEAEMTLFDGGVPVATESAGAAGMGDMGQVFFDSLSPGLYSYAIELDGYEEATGSTTISGDVVESVIMEESE